MEPLDHAKAAFYAGKRTAALPFVLNDSVVVLSGHFGRVPGSVASLVSLEPLKYLVECGGEGDDCVAAANDLLLRTDPRTALFRPVVTGVEFDWVACDRDGHVALLASAGSGVVSPSVAVDGDDAEDLIGRLAALPETGRAHSKAGLAHDADGQWESLGKRGIFVYDFALGARSYQQIVTPASPTRLDGLPVALRTEVGKVRLAGAEFAVMEVLGLETLVAESVG